MSQSRAFVPADRQVVVERLAEAGCVAPEEEADELISAANGDLEALAPMVERRAAGEPLAWVTGSTTFCGHRLGVHPGVYVPRWQSEPLARRAVELLPDDGLAADLCAGCGAMAATLARARPGARVVATDIDEAACRNAAANGVEVYKGHLAEPLPTGLRGRFDVVVSVPPYVPTGEMVFLPRDVRDHEPRLALDGGADGTAVLQDVVWSGAELLRPGGYLLVEAGGDQDELLEPVFSQAGYSCLRTWRDDDGDLRGVEAVYQGRRAARVVIVDEQDRVLLLSGRDPAGPASPRFWFVPGGGVARGEGLEEAGRREVYEETGAQLVDLGPVVWERDVSFEFDGAPFAQHEWYFLVRAGHFSPRPAGLTALEERSAIAARWWSLSDLAQAEAPVHPPGLADLVTAWLSRGPV